jgi:hypothetical protein
MTNTALTVQQAYSIDKKIDDGLPQSGRVMAMYDGWMAALTCDGWAAGGNVNPIIGQQNCGDLNQSTGGPVTSAGGIGSGSASGPPYGTANTCYDGSQGLPEQYSMGVNGGAGINCALSFQFQ